MTEMNGKSFIYRLDDTIREAHAQGLLPPLPQGPVPVFETAFQELKGMEDFQRAFGSKLMFAPSA